MKNTRGQALVLVLLSLAVVLTLILFILSRSVTDILVSSKNEETSRAFSAAEAGIEQALVIGAGGSNANLGNNAGYSSSVTGFATGQTSFIYPLELSPGDSMTLWLKSQDTSPDYTGTTVKICWGKTGTVGNGNATAPAIETSLFYGATPATVKIARAAFDPNSSRLGTNSFTQANSLCTVNGQSFAFYQTINLAGVASPQFIRIKMFYNTTSGHPIAFDSTSLSVFPSQGQDVISTGTAGQSTRKLDVFQGWPEFPSVFDYSIYSPGGLTK